MAIIRPGSFSFPRQWNPTQVPTWPVEVDWTHPLSNGLVGCYIPGGPAGWRDLCSIGPTLGLANGRVNYGQSPVGPGTTYPFGLVSTAIPVAYQFATAMSMTNLVYMPNGSELSDSFCIGTPSAESEAFLIVGSTDNRFRIGGSDFQMGSLGANGLKCLTGSVVFGGALAAYSNGVSMVTSGSAPAAPSYTNAVLSFGYYIGNLNSANTAVQLLGLLHNRALNANEAGWLAAEPFAMLRPVVRRSYFVAAAAGGYAGTIALVPWHWNTSPISTNQKQQINAALVAWQWKTAPISTNAQTGLKVSAVVWRWTASALGTNAQTMLAVSKAAWSWTARAINVNQQAAMTIAVKAWTWTGRSLTLTIQVSLTLVTTGWRWTTKVFSGYGAKSGLGGVMRGIGRRVGRGIIRAMRK